MKPSGSYIGYLSFIIMFICIIHIETSFIISLINGSVYHNTTFASEHLLVVLSCEFGQLFFFLFISILLTYVYTENFGSLCLFLWILCGYASLA